MSKNIVLLYFFLCIALLPLNTGLSAAEIKTTSPDGNIEILFSLNNNGEPLYCISCNGHKFLNWSKLGLNINGSGMLDSDLKLISVIRNKTDETFRIFSGKSKYSRSYYNETKISLEEKKSPSRKINIYFRAYNDGAAFRYGLPEQLNMSNFVILTEETYFNFADDYQCWASKTDRFRHSYEREYRKYNLSSVNNTPGDTASFFPYIALPVTMKMNDELYVCLSEANITNYPGMYLTKSDNYTLKSKLAPDINNADVAVNGKTPAFTPWRLFITGNKPGKLIESNLIMNLNDPCEISDAADWIKPGKSAWSWWAEDRGFDPAFGYSILSTGTVKYYIDFAAENNIQYVTLDGGWYGWLHLGKPVDTHDITKTLPELDLPDVSAYASSKGIGLILWVMWDDLEKQFDAALDYYQSLGIKGIKMDFMDRDDQFMTGFYRRVAEECAKRKMIVNLHGAYKPDGLCRTLPNILTYEGVLGNEYSRWSPGFPNPEHNLTLPFTRMIAGPMDYTPGSFTNSTKENYIARWKYPITIGTRAQQIAMTVVYESGILTLCESPAVYKRSPEFDFLKKVPAAWDSTIVLDGNIGEYIIIARKKDDNWFIGAMTNSNSRDIIIDMGFLDNLSCEAEIYSDSPDADINPSNVAISKLNISKSDKLSFRLAKGGGLAMIIKKISP